jgi:dTDP-6-deoxy-L-talose 4-dehydrogenase (NAD+)
MRILLTGPTGFIGSRFAQLALSQGHQVAGLALPNEVIPSWLPATLQIVWLRGTLDQAPWSEIEAFKPDACVHTAWITTPGVYLESPANEQFRDDSLKFIRKAREAGVTYVVGLGSCLEYQLGDQPLSEERTPLVPSTTYARCKNELRVALEADARKDHFGFAWGRVYYIYGPGEHPSRLCSSLIQKLAHREKLTLKTPDSTKDYIYVADVTSALLIVLEKRFQGPINIGTGTGVTVRQIAETLGSLMHCPELVRIADPPERDPFPFVVADASRLRGLGWQPAWTLERGLRALVAEKTANPR